jgi:hypothetical protein
MTVLWVSFAALGKSAGGPTSYVASIRYRAILPAAGLAALGMPAKVVHLHAQANRRTLLDRFAGAQAIVLGKLPTMPADFERQLRDVLHLVPQLRARGIAVLVDFSDDHLSDPVMGVGYRTLACAVDRVTASTQALATVIREHTPAPVSVITDPVEGPQGEPRVSSQDRVNLLWFGHPANLDTLAYGLRQIASLPHTLTLVTAPGSRGEAVAANAAARFRPWSVRAVFEELNACDAVVIPSNPHDPRKAVRSPNRFTETAWAGRFALAHPLPSYEELAAGGWVGEDLGEGLRWYMDNRAAAMERIRAGQALVSERHSPAAVALLWRSAILETISR